MPLVASGYIRNVMKKKIPDELVRFQVVLTRYTLERLDIIKEQVDATTRVEVLRNSLRVYDMIVEEISKDNEILIKEKMAILVK